MNHARSRIIKASIVGAIIASLSSAVFTPRGNHLSVSDIAGIVAIAFYLGAGTVYGMRFARYPFRGWLVSAQLWFAGKVCQWVLAVAGGAVLLPFLFTADVRTLRKTASPSVGAARQTDN